MKEALGNSKVSVDFSNEDLETIANKAQGYTCCDILVLIRDASYAPLRRLLKAKKFKKLQNGKFAIASSIEEG